MIVYYICLDDALKKRFPIARIFNDDKFERFRIFYKIHQIIHLRSKSVWSILIMINTG